MWKKIIFSCLALFFIFGLLNSFLIKDALCQASGGLVGDHEGIQLPGDIQAEPWHRIRKASEGTEPWAPGAGDGTGNPGKSGGGGSGSEIVPADGPTTGGS